jgi:coenzyme F420 biosynthesis associated uncharacterized protein
VDPVIDWRLADTVARAVASAAPSPHSSLEGLTAEVDGFAANSAHLVTDYTGLDPGDGLPVPETIDRGGWATTNLGSIRSVLDPVAGRATEGLGPLAGPVSVALGSLVAVEVGALSGFLSARVLGQYEFPILDPAQPARLLFVGPNLAQAARQLGTDHRTLTRWVALHETTHALQFTGVPWLRAYLAGRVEQLVASLDVAVDPRRMLRLPTGDDLRSLVEAVRRGELIQLAVGPERRPVFDELQALMALLEGYAEHVMDAVGEKLLPDLPRLRAGLERRRRDRSGLLRLLEKLIGLDLKLRQYEDGKRFCDAVVETGGIEALNRAWSSPEALPTLAELDAPARWLERTAA